MNRLATLAILAHLGCTVETEASAPQASAPRASAPRASVVDKTFGLVQTD